METEQVQHNTNAQQFEISKEGNLAVLQYQMQGDRIVFTHTGVPPELEGQGIGSTLARAGLDYARENGLQVVPLCPFVRSYIQRHPDYQDLVAA